jgi:hypothetical protein
MKEMKNIASKIAHYALAINEFWNEPTITWAR